MEVKLFASTQSWQAEQLGLNFHSLIPEPVCFSKLESAENEIQEKEGARQLNFDVRS